jgi:nucleoside-diphosphate-sugar epimerase
MSAVVAVLGAAGFIGNRTVEMLHLGGSHQVRPVVRHASSLALPRRFAVSAAIADATDEAALANAFAGCTHVVHAVAGDPATIVGSIEPTYRAAAAARVRRLVYLSSASVHGQSPRPGTSEDSPLDDRQRFAYNNAKVAAEHLLQRLRGDGRVEVVILRPGIVHGPRSQWTGGFADELLDGTAYLVGGGRGICNSTYVDNLVYAVALALDAPGADGEAYLLGDAETITWADLCRPVAHALGFDLGSIAVPIPLETDADDRRQVVRAAAKRVSARLPARVRRTLRAGYAEWRRGAGPVAEAHGTEITRERIDLHTCSVKLPYDKAFRHLGYAPVVSFDTAGQHAVSWLEFAGYPMARGVPCSEETSHR